MEGKANGQAAGMASKTGKGEVRGSFSMKVLINQGFSGKEAHNTLQFNLAMEAELIQAIQDRRKK